MRGLHTHRKALVIVIVAALLVQLSACGTLMYPERKGQSGGKIDIGVALLDGAGLLLFLIPGIIAYAVDFSNGTIYLPSGKSSSISDDAGIKVVQVSPEKLDQTTIESIVIREAAVPGTIDLSIAEVRGLDGPEDVIEALTRIRRSGVTEG